MPSTLAPDRLGVGSRRIPSRDIRPPEGEVTLSQELRTVGLLRPHVLVGYRWSYIGLCPGCKSSHNRHIRSFVSQPPLIRACTSNAPGSSRCGAVPHTVHSLSVTRWEARRPRRGPASGPQRGTPFAPQGPGGPVPPLRRYYGALRLLAVHLAALRFLRLAITTVSSPIRPHRLGTGAVDQPGVGKPGSMPAVNDGDGKVSQVPCHNAPFVTIVLWA